MKTWAEKLREDRRSYILIILSQEKGYSINTTNLQRALHHVGVLSSHDDVMTDTAWLRDQGLVKLEPVPEVEGLLICGITVRGNDAAAGVVEVPGVSRPQPR